MFSRVINSILITISIILGIVIAVIFADRLIPYMRTVFKINLVLSTLLLLIYIAILALSYFINNPKIRYCLVSPGITLVVSSIGTLVTSIIAIALVVDPASVFVKILVGFAGFFFSLMIFSLINFICCLIRKSKRFPNFA